MIDLSILIVGYNDGKYLDDCIGSVYRETGKTDFEVIYIDNNSSDNSVEIIKSKFPRVRIIQNRSNLGFTRANNIGLKLYQGRYALLLNTDTIIRERALEKMVEFMDANPHAGACGPKLLNVDGTPQHQGGLFARKFWLEKDPVKVDYVIGACLMVRREVIKKVGVMDENFFFSNDDLDWCRRIRKAGWDVYCLPSAEVTHYGGFTTKRFNPRLFVEGFRGGLYFAKKHYGAFAYYVYRFLLLIVMAMAASFLLLFYPLHRKKEKLAAYWQILALAITGDILPVYNLGRNVLLVSNGHAEDLAAAAIGSRTREIDTEISLRALPLVGLGKAYDNADIRNLGIRKTLPSGGFAKEGLWYFIKDLFAGLPLALLKQISVMRRESKNSDLVVAVGDALVVALCGLFVRKPMIFVDGPKSVRIAGYWKLEKWLMRKFCKKIIVQDQETAAYLKKQGLPAEYLGSWVMDYVTVTGEDFGIDRQKTVIGMLPGTREEAYDNLLSILEVYKTIHEKYPAKERLIGLVASTLDLNRLKEKVSAAGWEFSPADPEENKRGITGTLSLEGANVIVSERKFADVCVRSNLIIGLAGIANEQAAAFGRPVVCFPGRGPQTTLRRWQEIQKITGRSMQILKGNSQEIAQQVLGLLNDPFTMEEMSRIGKASKPQWGGIERIAELVIKTLSTPPQK